MYGSDGGLSLTVVVFSGRYAGFSSLYIQKNFVYIQRYSVLDNNESVRQMKKYTCRSWWLWLVMIKASLGSQYKVSSIHETRSRSKSSNVCQQTSLTSSAAWNFLNSKNDRRFTWYAAEDFLRSPAGFIVYNMTGVSEANVDDPFLVECNGIEDKGKKTTENKEEEGWESLYLCWRSANTWIFWLMGVKWNY